MFSPRLAAMFKPCRDHSVRVSFNRAFRSPSVINNYLDISIVVPTDLSALAPLLPPPLQPLVAQPFPLVVRAVGSELPIGATPQPELTEESLTAYEVAYTGTFGDRTTVGVAFYVNDLDNNINFVQLPTTSIRTRRRTRRRAGRCRRRSSTLLAQRGIFLPRTAFTYLNLGPAAPEGRRALGRSPRQPQRHGVRELLLAGEADGARRSESVSVAGARAAAAFYVNDLDDSINFVQLPSNRDPYTAANPPPGWPLPPSSSRSMAQHGHLPAADGVHVSEPRAAAREGRRALARSADQQGR